MTWLADGEMDLRKDGQVELRFDVEEAPERKKAGSVVKGVVTRCEPFRVLEYSWIATSAKNRTPEENPVPDSIVSFELEPRGDDVLLVLTHRRLPAAFLVNTGAGWHTHLGTLDARLRGQEPEPFLAVFRRVQPTYGELAAHI